MKRSGLKMHVLCFFRYWARVEGQTVEIHDATMIGVYFSGRITSAFQAKMQNLVKYSEWKIGPRPATWELIGWLTERGDYVKLSTSSETAAIRAYRRNG